MSKQFSTYEKLVFAAYGYFIVLGLVQFLKGLTAQHSYFDFFALAIIIVFGIQTYFRKKLTNLILGILTLGISIFLLLTFLYGGSINGFSLIVKLMLMSSIISIIMSGILIFSYTKLGFKDEQ